jgi:hypothetical protein
MYDDAYEISLEPSWGRSGSPGEGRGERRFSGWTAREDFVDRMNRELGPGGSNIRLGSVRAGQLEQDGGVSASDESDPAPTGALPPRIDRLEDTYRVAVKGHMLGACSIFRWEKELVVVKYDGRYKVLLDGTRGGRGLFYQSWFENVEKLSDLRGGGKNRVFQ